MLSVKVAELLVPVLYLQSLNNYSPKGIKKRAFYMLSFFDFYMLKTNLIARYHYLHLLSNIPMPEYF